MARCSLVLVLCFALFLPSWLASRLALEKKKALTLPLREQARRATSNNEFSTGGFAVHDMVEALGHGPSGGREWFKAEVTSLRSPPAWPPIVVKYMATLGGVTNRLALPEPVSAYLCADHVRRNSTNRDESFWLVGGDKVGRRGGSKKRAHSQQVDLAKTNPIGFWAIHHASSGLLNTLDSSMLWALHCRRRGDGKFELVDGSFHSDLVVGGHQRTFGQIWAEVDKAAVEDLFQEAKTKAEAQNSSSAQDSE